MDEGIKESITQAVKERLSSPLWGYIFFSWVGFNWKNLAILFMSNETVEERISKISAQEWFYLEYLFAPIILGVLLAILSPYFKQWLSATHRRAEQKQREGIKKKITNRYDDDIEIADKKIAAENAEKLAKEKENTKIIQEKEKQKREAFDTNALEEKVATLKNQHKSLEISLHEVMTQKEEAHKELEFWKTKVSLTMETLNGYHNISDNRSISKIKDELSNLFSSEDLEVAGYAVQQKVKQEEILKKNATEALKILTETFGIDGKNHELKAQYSNEQNNSFEYLSSLLKEIHSNTLTPFERINLIRKNLGRSSAQ
ncbi:hypothetical protein [Pantoea ananatis]|uniref:hypothetical protein n=1 Tax=Pantoea ananas TaxID=553 RepID=UPI00119EA60C|nr:hypothetical protein [Pantoea ananatis]